MDAGQVKAWLGYHCQLFPDFASWWRELGESSRTAIRDEWISILRGTATDDADDASRQMLAGAQEHPPRYSYQQLASRVASIAREAVFARTPKPRESDPRYLPSRSGDGPTAGEIFALAVKAHEEGRDAKAVLEELIPAREPEFWRSYRCRKCLDTGLVSVWSTQSLAYAFRGEEPPMNKRSTMLCPCDCHAGDSKVLGDNDRAPQGWHGWRVSARYAPDRYCRCDRDQVDAPERIAELLEWACDYKRPNHVAAFDHWNNS